MSHRAGDVNSPCPSGTGITIRANINRGRASAGASVPPIRIDVLRASVAAMIIMVVSRSQQFFPWLAASRPLLVLAIASVAFSILNPRALARDNVLRYWWTLSIVALAIQVCLSVPFGISMGNSGQFILFNYSTVLILAGLVIVSTRSVADLVTYVSALLFGIASLAFQANVTFQLTNQGSGLDRLQSTFGFDANDVGLMFVSTLPIAIALVPAWKGWRRIALVMLLIGVGAGIARTGSRGAFVGLVISGCVMLAMSRAFSLSRRLLIFGLTLVALTIAAPPGYFDQMSSTFSPEADYNWTAPSGRRAVALRGLGYMMQYPLFGLGIDNFMKAECTISERVQGPGGSDGVRCTPPHNTWIQAGAELGVPGLIIWLVMLILPLTKLTVLSRRLPLAWRRGDFEQRFLFACSTGLPVALVGFMVASSFLTFAWLDIPYLLSVLSGFTWLFASRRLASENSGMIAPSSYPMADGFRRRAMRNRVPAPDTISALPYASGTPRRPRSS